MCTCGVCGVCTCGVCVCVSVCVVFVVCGCEVCVLCLCGVCVYVWCVCVWCVLCVVCVLCVWCVRACVWSGVNRNRNLHHLFFHMCMLVYSKQFIIKYAWYEHNNVIHRNGCVCKCFHA